MNDELIPQGEDLKTEVKKEGKELKTSLHYDKELLGRKPETDEISK